MHLLYISFTCKSYRRDAGLLLNMTVAKGISAGFIIRNYGKYRLGPNMYTYSAACCTFLGPFILFIYQKGIHNLSFSLVGWERYPDHVD